MDDNAAVRKPLRPEVGRYKYWEHLIEKELRGGTKDPKNNTCEVWDPHRAMNYSHAAIDEFFSGHKMRIGKIRDRDAFLRWAIEEVNSNFPYNVHQTLVEDSDTSKRRDMDEATGAPSKPENTDLDAKLSSTKPDESGEDASEKLRKLKSVARGAIATFPNSIGPPANDCFRYLDMKCKINAPGRNQYGNPELFGDTTFFATQVTAIVWLLSRLCGGLPKLKASEEKRDKENRESLRGPRYFGGILADSMGLGKTRTIIGLLIIMLTKGLTLQKQVDENGRTKKKKLHRPILILAPNSTVAAQWVEEILTRISRELVDTVIVAGASSSTTNKLGRSRSSIYREDSRIKELTPEGFKSWPNLLQWVWDECDEEASRVVLVMPIQTWAERTLSRSKETVGERGEEGLRRQPKKAEQPQWKSEFDSRRFSMVVVDEAYKIKNPATKCWKSVQALQRMYTVLVTATPVMNSMSDLFGLGRLLWDAPERYLREHQPELWKKVDEEFQDPDDLSKLDSKEPWDLMQLVAGREGLLAKLLGKQGRSGVNTEQIRKSLGYFEKLAILRRGPGSYLWAERGDKGRLTLDKLLPPVQTYSVRVQQHPSLAPKLQQAHLSTLTKYINGLQSAGRKAQSHAPAPDEETDLDDDLDGMGGRGKSRPGNFHATNRKLVILAASYDVYRFNAILETNGWNTQSRSVSEMRERGLTFTTFAKFLLEPHEPAPKTAVEYIKLAVRNSPVLQYILEYLKEHILKRQGKEPLKKLLITESIPILAYYYELVLQFLQISCRVFHAGLSPEERQNLIRSFNSDQQGSCQVLIQMYTVGFAGTNLHENCAKVLIASQAHNLAVQRQAIHRVIRINQEKSVTVHRVTVENTIHDFVESRQVEKILPELGAQAQGRASVLMVKLLNRFQAEIEDAWDSQPGQSLVRTMNLLTDQFLQANSLDDEKNEELWTAKKHCGGGFSHEDQRDVPDLGMMKAENIKQENLKEEDSGDGDLQMLLCKPLPPASGLTEKKHRYAAVKGRFLKRKRDDLREKQQQGGNGWPFTGEPLQPDFLALRTRGDYHKEHKELPRVAQAYLDHDKNQLRRLLSYHYYLERSNKTQWDEGDLERHPALLERGLELMLRVSLEAPKLALLPLPKIDFSLTPLQEQDKLCRELNDAASLSQLYKAIRNEDDDEAVKQKLALIKPGKSLSEIEKELLREDELAGARNEFKGLHGEQCEHGKGIERMGVPAINEDGTVPEDDESEMSEEESHKEEGSASDENEDPDSDDENKSSHGKHHDSMKMKGSVKEGELDRTIEKNKHHEDEGYESDFARKQAQKTSQQGRKEAGQVSVLQKEHLEIGKSTVDQKGGAEVVREQRAEEVKDNVEEEPGKEDDEVIVVSWRRAEEPEDKIKEEPQEEDNEVVVVSSETAVKVKEELEREDDEVTVLSANPAHATGSGASSPKRAMMIDLIMAED